MNSAYRLLLDCLPLAISDSWVMGMFFANFLSNILIVVWIGPRVRKTETIEQTLHAESQRQIDARFDGLRTLILEKLEGVWASVGRINARLGEGDQMFAKLVDRDHLEAMKVLEQFGKLREWMMLNFASKEDLDKVCERIEQQNRREA